MKKFFLGIMALMCMLPALGNVNKCVSKVVGYKVLKNSIYPFVVNKEKACFFAFYTANPEPMTDVQGDGNLGDALWYGYYLMGDPGKIYEFPKPKDKFWGSVCSISAISFYPMHGGKKRDVTIIGSCDKQNTGNYTFPFVFIWKGNKYVLDEDVYSSLYAFVSLTVADVRAYIKSPDTCYKILKNRFNMDDEGKIACE